MFDIGFLEIMMIGVVSLVVIGPERLPEVAAKVGKTVAKAQRFVRGVKSDINRELESGDLKELLGDQKKQIEELRQMVHTASKDIETSTSTALKDAEKTISDAKDGSILESTTDSTPVESLASDATPDETETNTGSLDTASNSSNNAS